MTCSLAHCCDCICGSMQPQIWTWDVYKLPISFLKIYYKCEKNLIVICCLKRGFRNEEKG